VSVTRPETQALVHFGDELTKAVVLMKQPKIGSEVEGASMPEGRWFVEHVISKTGERDGLEYFYAVWARRAR
jgi:hypothetical protein